MRLTSSMVAVLCLLFFTACIFTGPRRGRSRHGVRRSHSRCHGKHHGKCHKPHHDRGRHRGHKKHDRD